MRNLVLIAVTLFGSIQVLLWSAENSFAQTAINNPAGTSVTLSSADTRAIGLNNGLTYTYSNSNWPGCISWGLPTTGLNLIRANILASSSCAYNSLSFNTGNGTNLAGGVAAWIGTTNYRATPGSGYQNYSVQTRLLITVTDNSNNPIELYQSGSYIFAAVAAGNNSFKVKVELQAKRPSGALYYSSSTTGTCNTGVNGWSPAIHLYNCLGTQSTYKICTQYPSTPSSRVFYQGFTTSTTSPAFNGSSPAHNSSTTSSSRTYQWSGSVGSHPASRYEYNLNSSGWVTNGSVTSRTVGLNLGANTFCVRYYDACSNSYYPNSGGVCRTVYYVVADACGSVVNWGGNNFIVSGNSTISGTHTNVGTFRVNSGVTATVATNCLLKVSAVTVDVDGTINGNGKGVSSGGGGSGGGCNYGDCRGITFCWSKDNCYALATRKGNRGGNGSDAGTNGGGDRGVNGTDGWGSKQECDFWGDDGGRVGGAGGAGGAKGGGYGGGGGNGKSGGNGGTASACSAGNCGGYGTGSGGAGSSAGGATYGNATTYSIQKGSGGGGGGGGGRGRNGSTSGSSGGRGGASIFLEASGNLYVSGTVKARGNNGGRGGHGGSGGTTSRCCTDWSNGCDEETRTGGGGGGGGAGGGSGGGILLSAAGIMDLDGTIDVKGGNGGQGGNAGAASGSAGAGRRGGGGGGGGGGRIKLFYNPCVANDLTATFTYGGGSGGGVGSGSAGGGTGNSGGTGSKQNIVYALTPGGSLPPAGRYVWNGSVSTNWNTGNNWSYYNGSTWTWGTVPGVGANCIVPGPPCVPVQPTISSNAGTINSLEIHANDGAEVTITCPNCLIVTQ